MGKKKFLDKKNSVTFYLAHRSQKDPLITDETASKRILVPIDQVPSTSGGTFSGVSDDKEEYKKKRKEEQQKFGIYFEDDYDYLQHLRIPKNVEIEKKPKDEEENSDEEEEDSDDEDEDDEVEEEEEETTVKLQLPASVFQSEFEEEIGLLNRAAPHSGPRPELDPDIVATLDDDFDFEDGENEELEDDFVMKANEPRPEGEEDSDDGSDYTGDSENDELGSLDAFKKGRLFSMNDEETKSRFTNYSMSSSVIPRNKNLSVLDEHFEQSIYKYDDEEIGALDCEEIEGFIDIKMLKELAEKELGKVSEEVELNNKILSLVLKAEAEMETDEDEDDEYLDSDEEKGPKWDCESILSTFSNTKNRPKVIRERGKIKLKGGIPTGVLDKGLTKSKLMELDNENSKGNNNEDLKSIKSGVSFIRPKNESLEDKRQRKHIVREIRKERRQEKKANTLAFRDEKKKQEKIELNKSVCRDLKL